MQIHFSHKGHQDLFRSPVPKAEARLRLESGEFVSDAEQPESLDQLQVFVENKALVQEANNLLALSKERADLMESLDNKDQDHNRAKGLVAWKFEGKGNGIIYKYEQEKSGSVPVSYVHRETYTKKEGMTVLDGSQKNTEGKLLIEEDFDYQNHVYTHSRSIEGSYSGKATLKRIEGDIYQIEITETDK